MSFWDCPLLITTAAGYRYNDRFEMECCVMEGLSGKDAWSETKSDGAKAAVLSRLPPALVLRMLAFTLAEAHTKRNFNDGRFPLLQVREMRRSNKPA